MTYEEMKRHPVMSKVLNVFERECSKLNKEDILFRIYFNGGEFNYNADKKSVREDQRGISIYTFSTEIKFEKETVGKKINSFEVYIYNKLIMRSEFLPGKEIKIKENVPITFDYELKL